MSKKIKTNQAIMRLCRICLAPEKDSVFSNFFDPAKNFAENLYFVCNIVVSSIVYSK